MSILEELFSHKMVDVPMRAMHWAISSRDLNFVKRLWELCDGKFYDEHPCECGYCIKTDHFNNFGDLALKRGDLAMVEFFLSKNAVFSRYSVVYAAASGKLDVVKWAIAHSETSQDKEININLGWAVVSGSRKSLEVVKFLDQKIKDYGQKLSDLHRSDAIATALGSGHDDIATYLRDQT